MSNGRPPLSPLAGKAGEIKEDRYRHDLALHDRFQGFGAELLRIASLGLAAFGFILLTKSTEETIATAIVRESLMLKVIISLSPLCFGLSVAYALMHRFQASDGMFHHFRAIKLIDLKKPHLAEQIAKEESIRNRKFKNSEKNLHRSAWALATGAALLALSFVWIMLTLAPSRT